MVVLSSTLGAKECIYKSALQISQCSLVIVDSSGHAAMHICIAFHACVGCVLCSHVCLGDNAIREIYEFFNFADLEPG